ncbi:isopeptide-forming domain-containing fimbrial protein [Bifidobacterium angulatum]|uniref:isopeptide-forming domain-containing fimbrial protein n=1 Tax=Bifidobacterium angulatum TaxID=1683 RepID=UPI003AAC43C8
MKMRKLFAGIAAAATLLGGMALGAVSAQADDAATTPLLQVNNAQEGHTYTPYRFATFENAGNGTVEVSTVEAWKDAVTAAADTANGNDSIPAEYKNNPAAYVATFNAEQIREFATELAETNPLPTADGAGLTVTAEQAGTAQPVAVSGEGWYLVTDTFTKSGETTATTGTPAVVATTVNGLTDLTIVPDKVTGQGNITTVGQFNAKTENPLTPPNKTAKVGDVDVDGKTVNVGDTVNFTVSATVPASAANYDVYPFTITDTASKGLKVAAANTFKVQVDGRDVDSSLYTVTQTGSAAVGTTTTITFASAKSLAGKTIVVSYTGTVTKDALTDLGGSVNNKAKITTNGGASGEGTTESKTYGFQFKKIGVDNDANALAGAQFVIKKKDGKFLKQDTESKAWSSVDDQTNATVFTSGADGLVQFKGLAAGDYTVMETNAPNGYAQNFKVTFDVSIAENGTVTFKQDLLHQVTLPTDDQIATVKNVKSITQLPLTGAAGTTLFIVVALLLAGAGVTVVVKSRQRMH